MNKVEDEYTREVNAWQYRSGFTAIDEKLIDDVFLELFINEKLQDSILTIRDNLRLLAMGHFFLSLQIRPEHISPNISLLGLKAELTLAENIIASDYPDLCYKRVCSCRPAAAHMDEEISLADNELTLEAARALEIFADFQDSSALFKETGGVHGAGLYSASGGKAAFFMDISRHNCISKAVGFLIELQAQKEIKPLAMMVSCRVNREIVRMAQKAGIKILMTRAAPALSAYSEALKSGITLVGFVKENRFTLFTGRERIIP
jgi:formate dehydrogenase accessory protein FdhD